MKSLWCFLGRHDWEVLRAPKLHPTSNVIYLYEDQYTGIKYEWYPNDLFPIGTYPVDRVCLKCEKIDEQYDAAILYCQDLSKREVWAKSQRKLRKEKAQEIINRKLREERAKEISKRTFEDCCE